MLLDFLLWLLLLLLLLLLLCLPGARHSSSHVQYSLFSLSCSDSLSILTFSLASPPDGRVLETSCAAVPSCPVVPRVKDGEDDEDEELTFSEGIIY